jgi:peptide deformylase
MRRVAVLAIRRFGDPVLKARAREVEVVSDLHRRLAVDMIDTMRDAPGVGLAGPQVGVMDRIFVWEVEEAHGAVINPVIVEASDEMVEDEEGCLSIPGLVYPVARSTACTIEGLDLDGRALRIEAEDFQARVFQHEIDHLDGVLFIDRLAPEHRKEALRILSSQALGLPTTAAPAHSEEAL